jgi:hypothetical protein
MQKYNFFTLGSIIILFPESTDAEKLVLENPSSNFFIDEAPVPEKSFPAETLAKMSRNISANNYLWIACQSDKVPHRQDPNLAGNYSILGTVGVA